MPNYTTVGELIAARWRPMGITKRELARRLGVEPSQLSKMLGNRTPGYLPQFELIPTICAVLGITQRELLAAAGYEVDPIGDDDDDEVSEVMLEARLRDSARRVSKTPEIEALFDGLIKLNAAERTRNQKH